MAGRQVASYPRADPKGGRHGSLLRRGGMVCGSTSEFFPQMEGEAIARAAVTAPADSLSVLDRFRSLLCYRRTGGKAVTRRPRAPARWSAGSRRQFGPSRRGSALSLRAAGRRRGVPIAAPSKPTPPSAPRADAATVIPRCAWCKGLEGDTVYERRFWSIVRPAEPDRMLAEAESGTVRCL